MAPARQSYESALKQVEALVEADDGYTARRDLSIVLNDLGTVSLNLGRTKQAIDYQKRSVRVMEGLHKADPKSAHAREDLGTAILGLARAELHSGDGPAALKHGRAARGLFAALVELDRNNTSFSRMLLSAWLFLGEAHQRAGDTRESIQSFEQAVEVGERLVKIDGKSVVLRQDLYVSLNKLGDAHLGQGATRTARTFYLRSLGHTTFAAKLDARNLEARHDLALVKGRLADAHARQGQTKEALALQQEATALIDGLVKAGPENIHFTWSKGGTYLRLGMLHESAQEAGPAEASYRKCVEAYDKLVALDPDSSRFRQDLLIGCNKMGDLRLLALNDRETSLRYYERAMTHAVWRAEKDRSDAEAQSDLVLQHMRLGRHALLDGRHAEARKRFEKALELLTGMDKQGMLKRAPVYFPREGQIKGQLALCDRASKSVADPKYALRQWLQVRPLLFQRALGLCQQGKHKEAADAVAKLHEQGPREPAVQINVARGYGRCAAALLKGKRPGDLGGAERAALADYRAKALAALERCVELGYEGPERLAADSDLASLREEEKYRKLAERLAKKRRAPGR
jgi:tetratricopeptide (TPR) repeat protein